MNTANEPVYDWNTIPWDKAERAVFKLQKRIYQASQRGDRCYLYPWWIIPGPNRLSALISGDRAQIGPYQPCPLQSFSGVDSHFSALESHTAHLCERMNN